MASSTLMVGAFIVRIPAPGWKPEGYTPQLQASKLITTSDVYVYDALKTPQFCMSQQRQFTSNKSRPRASAAL